MLKNRLLSDPYTSYINKTCGEIVCQTENRFTFICKLCDIKIFEYDDFITHFRVTHWPDICGDHVVSKQQQSNIRHNREHSILKIAIKSGNDFNKLKQLSNTCNNQQIECVKLQDDNKTNIDGFNNFDEAEAIKSDIQIDNESSDSEEFSKPLAIMKKNVGEVLENGKEKFFECTQCNRKFTTSFYLRFHIRQQHEQKKFPCDKCDKLFVEKRYLALHQRCHIGYTCQICQKVFDKYEAMRYHSESHIQTRNFICEYKSCGKAFPNNRRLSAHKRTHYAQPTFVCEICGSMQRSKEFLIVHIRTHTGEKPYACNQCDRCFASKHFLHEHQAVHSTERPHACTVCGKTFASSKSLYHHRQLHSETKKYLCKICNNAFSQAAGLSAHMRKHKQNRDFLDTDPTVVSADNTFY